MKTKVIIAASVVVLIGVAMAGYFIGVSSATRLQEIKQPEIERSIKETPLPAEAITPEKQQEEIPKEKVAVLPETTKEEVDSEEEAIQEEENEQTEGEAVQKSDSESEDKTTEEKEPEKRPDLKINLEEPAVRFKKFDDRLEFSVRLKIRNEGNESTGGGAINSSVRFKLFRREHQLDFSEKISYIHPGHDYQTWIHGAISPTPQQMAEILGRSISIPVAINVHVWYKTLSMATIPDEHETEATFNVTASA